jgi:hypothetical protein
VVLAVAAGALTLCLAAPSRAADAQQQQSFGYWKGQDNCAKSARKQFPDYTKESNAKREQAFRTCMLNSGRFGHPALDPAPGGPEGATARAPQ